MTEALQFLLRHGYAVVFGFVLAEQIGLPVPSIPILLALGALAGRRELSLTLGLALGMVATLGADLVWYWLGERRGHSILRLLCRISLEPDSCVRQTEDVFVKHGARSLVVAKFVPGLATAAPPIAGMLRMRLRRFLLFDGLGALVYLGGFSLLGYAFSSQLERVAGVALRLGSWLAVILVGGLASYIAWKYDQRRRFIRKLRIARITPEELKRKLDAGENITVVDLRSSVEFEGEDTKIRGALHFLPEDIETRHQEIPRDRDVVLYCT
ncbi:MAG TPA: VTT domain-containing protein [Terriglobia bacterium]|nr:VTT domain-containing protein [Terriglobia bacterium]